MTQTSDHRSVRSAPVARPAAASAPPKMLGRWELLRVVGEGNLAWVYEARPAGSAAAHNSYAIKTPKPPWDTDARGLQMLYREAWVGRNLSHPHVLPVLAANVQEPPYFLVLPLLEGQPLAALLAAEPCPGVATALWIARQTAEGLSALHAAGWMHADVKPSNIFVSQTGHVTLIDLGFARKHSEMGSVADRPILGTLNYMAPEMLTSALAADIRSDIYSLGATLFQMLTGRLPFEGKTIQNLALQHRQGLPDDLRALAPQLPTRVARLVRQMLAKEPLRRPQTPQDLVERLVALEIESFDDRDFAVPAY